MRTSPRPAHKYPSYRDKAPNLVGGALCLDFVNTEEWRGAPERAERLVDYGELLAWTRASGAIGESACRRLAAVAAAKPGAAKSALDSARDLREILDRLFTARAARSSLVARFNAWLARAPERRRLAAAADGVGWARAASPDDLLAPLWPVVWSAADLLVSQRADDVHGCADRRCGWLFLDASRSKPRRWCSMESCGNRAKARRHYRRRRAS